MNASTPVRRAFPISNGYGPADGAKGLPMEFSWANVASHYVDMYLDDVENVIRNIQAVYVDNSQNAAAVTLLIGVTQQRLVVPATAQGMWPIISIPEMKFTISSAQAAGQSTRIILMNVPQPISQWGPTVISGNTINVESLTTGNWTDLSGSIAVGGVSQQIVAANANRKQIVVQNPSSEIESLFLNFDDPASPSDSIEIPPGGMYDTKNVVSLGAVSVVAATGGHNFVAKELE